MNDATSDPAQAERLTCALGRGVVEAWSALPRSIQQLIFEQPVLAGHHSERDESLREQLAAFLHARHPQAAFSHGVKALPSTHKRKQIIRSELTTRTNRGHSSTMGGGR